ncbi:MULTISPECIES: hypothetical protein [unclassified Polaribacter]|uniref:hypothetical protein n=1 Tax=unclassified Polaribacter TaxID=196858 RepID=UPI0011BD99C1|nr:MULTISPECIES: hypothetical protein [unclassified Polaribacter]TXD54214.1 hypothetical protein ES043_01565 [Polaribacter sp. IC063]TXD62479.1 hypothetical protein ES044_01775 [Polaribacter sp. IC066]
MKKLLCIAFFSIAIMVNATAKKETVTNNSKEVMIEKSDLDKKLKTENIEFNTDISEVDMFFGSGSQGNSMYAEYRGAGMSHRDARAERRAYVRDFRGNGPDEWLSIFIS